MSLFVNTRETILDISHVIFASSQGAGTTIPSRSLRDGLAANYCRISFERHYSQGADVFFGRHSFKPTRILQPIYLDVQLSDEPF